MLAATTTASTPPRRPVLRALSHISAKNIKGELFGGVAAAIVALPLLVANARPTAVILAAITLAILWLTPAAVKKIAPPQLIALVVGTLLSLTLLTGGTEEIRRIGELASCFPQLRVPYFELDDLRVMLVDAATLGMLGCIDALFTAVIADSITRTEHDSNKELIGQGLDNLVSGLFGGLPGAGATMGTVLNIQAGGAQRPLRDQPCRDPDAGNPRPSRIWPPRFPRPFWPASRSRWVSTSSTGASSSGLT